MAVTTNAWSGDVTFFLLFPLYTVRPPRLLSFPASELLFPRIGRVRAPPGHALSLLDHLSAPSTHFVQRPGRGGHRGAATGGAPPGQPPTAAAAVLHGPSPQARTAPLPAPPLPPPSHLADAAGVQQSAMVPAAAAAAAAVGAAAAASSTKAGRRDHRRSLPLPAAAAAAAATTATATAKAASGTAWREWPQLARPRRRVGGTGAAWGSPHHALHACRDWSEKTSRCRRSAPRAHPHER